MTQIENQKNGPSKTTTTLPTRGRAKPYDLVIIGVDTKDGDEHPLFDRRINIPLSPERIRSYAKFGVDTDVAVKRGADGKLVLANGRTRTRYARAVWDLQAKNGIPEDKRITVPWKLVDGTDAELWDYGRAMNQFDKSGGVMHAFEVMKTLRLNGGDYKKAALTYGVSEQSIRNSERVATKLDPELLSKVEAKELTMTAAIELTYLPVEEQKTVLADLKDEGAEPNVENIKRKAKQKKGKQGASLRDKVDRVEIALRKFAGTAPTEANMTSLLDYISRQLTGKPVAKLVEKEPEEKKAKSKAKKN